MFNFTLHVCTKFSHGEHWCASRCWCSHTRHNFFLKSKITQTEYDYCKLVTIACQNTFPCIVLYGTIGHQAIYTSLWLTISLRNPLSIVCCCKQWLVHVRIHNPVWEVFINVVTSLKVQVLVFISSLEYLSNPAATSAKRWHSMEEFVQNKWSHYKQYLNRKRISSNCIHYEENC